MLSSFPSTDQIDLFAENPLVREITIQAFISQKSITDFCTENFEFFKLPFNKLVIIISTLVEKQFLKITNGVLTKGNCYPYEQFRKGNEVERISEVEKTEKSMQSVTTNALIQYIPKQQNIDPNKVSLLEKAPPFYKNSSLYFTQSSAVEELGSSGTIDLNSSNVMPVDDPSKCMAFVCNGGDVANLLAELIVKSSLSVRAIKVLLENYTSFEEFVSLDYEALLNYGRDVLSEITEFQYRMSCIDLKSSNAVPAADPLKCLSFVHRGGCATCLWFELIAKSSLSVRATNILLKNCNSFEELFSLDYEALLKFTNCGRNTASEVIEFQKRMRSFGLKFGNVMPIDVPSNCLPFVCSGGSVANLLSDLIAKSSLSVRATNVLLNNCTSLEELLSLDYKELLDFRNCGRNTLSEIVEFQNRMRVGQFAQVLPPQPQVEPVVDILRLPPTEYSLRLLPFFSLKQLDRETVNEIHKGFQTEVQLTDIVLSVRTATVLNLLGFKTIGDIMFVPGGNLLKEQNFGRKCLKELQDVIRKIVLQENNQLWGFTNKLDFSSYETLVRTFLGHCLKKRSQELISKRLCFQTGKLPTLEQLGEQFAITRERARQILKNGYKTLKIKENLDLLKGLGDNIDYIVTNGGGIITLGELSFALQEKYGWLLPPHPPALGQLLSLLKPNQSAVGAKDLIKVECECLTCDESFEKFISFDFQEHQSIHIKVAAKNLAKHCLTTCARRTVQMFHSAYIEMLVERTNADYMIHDDLIMPHDRWLLRHGFKLEDIIMHVLERNGKPMHFSEITPIIQKENLKHWDISDHNVHASLMRFDAVEIISRGTYGLKSWEQGGYRSVSTAIEELLDTSNRPLRRAEIIQQLSQEFSEGNITAALGKETRFFSIGEGFYDRPARWRQRTCQSMIDQLPEPLADFAHYLIGNYNCSYKFVLALVFVRGMEENGSFYLSTLKDRFFSFYQGRKKNGFVVEIDSAIISRIGELEDSVIKNNAASKPIISFLSSPFFVQNGSAIFLQGVLVSLLSDFSIRNLFMVIMLKKIDDYFTELAPAIFHREITCETEAVFGSCDDDHSTSLSINIKKKDRGKIRL